MIPEQYISNNLSLLCEEINDEFNNKFKLSMNCIVLFL